VEVVIREGRGSVSLLQRALGIGYGRAARLIDFMEQDGVVGVYAGSKSREVIMTMSQWHDLQSASPAAERTELECPFFSTRF
jgi:S-DNA-T family DNA segregation ATPase FtsK/SpoIIIE